MELFIYLCFQLLQRGKSREQRLQDALRNIQGNAALVEELLSWLTEAQVLLATKEKDPIPEDLKVVETLAKEHSVSLVPYLISLTINSPLPRSYQAARQLLWTIYTSSQEI